MGNENVEFNEVRCKNLILGDEQTGYINLTVNKIDESPFLEIKPNDGNEDSSITIGYKDGKPILTLTTNKTNEKKHIIKLYFGDGDMPIMEMGAQEDETNYDNLIALGLTDDGTPLLAMATEFEEDTSVVAGLFINEKGHANLVLKNESVKGGWIVIRADDDGGGILMRTNEDPSVENESQKTNRGILLINSSKVTLMDIKGQTIGGKNIQEENTSSGGESNE